MHDSYPQRIRYAHIPPVGALAGQLGTGAPKKDWETYPKQSDNTIKNRCPQKYPFSLCNFFKTVKNLRYSSIMVPCLYFTPNHSVYSDLRKPTLFPLKCHFSDPKRWQRCTLPSLKKSTLSHRFCLFKHRYQVDHQAPPGHILMQNAIWILKDSL